MSQVGLLQRFVASEIADLDRKLGEEIGSLAAGGAADFTDYKRRVERVKLMREMQVQIKEKFSKVVEDDDD